MKELDIQCASIKAIKRQYPKAVIVANPLSELQLHYQSQKAKFAALQRAKKAGWDKAQPDLIVIVSGKTVGIELKTPKTNPFRSFRGGGMWIDKTQDWQGREHVMSQLAYLDRMRRQGAGAFLCVSPEQCLFALAHALGEPIECENYKFSYSLTADCEVNYFA